MEVVVRVTIENHSDRLFDALRSLLLGGGFGAFVLWGFVFVCRLVGRGVVFLTPVLLLFLCCLLGLGL